MAKRRRSSSPRVITRTITVPGRTAAPIVNVRVPRQSSGLSRSVRRRGRRIAKRAVGVVAGEKHNLIAAGGAFLLGHLQKTGDLAKVPRILGLGPIGSAALISWAASKYFVKSPTARAMASGMVCVAAFNFGSTGQVSGGDVMGYGGGAAVYG